MRTDPRRVDFRRACVAVVLCASLIAMTTQTAVAAAPPLSDALGALGDLAKQAQDQSRSEADRLPLIEALGQWQTEQVRPPLLALLGDPIPSIRAAAARALGWPGNRAAVAALKERAEVPGEAPAVRAGALEALGRIGDDSARDVMVS